MSDFIGRQAESLLQKFFESNEFIRRVGGGSVVLGGLYLLKIYSDSQVSTTRPTIANRAGADRKPKAKVDKQFFVNLRHFLPILVPGFYTKEAFNLLAVGLVLLCRTWLDFWMIANNAEVLGKVGSTYAYCFRSPISTILALPSPSENLL